MQQTVQQLQLRGAAAKVAETEARTEKLHADANAAGAKAQSASILDQQHAVNTAATIADIAHKTAQTHHLSSETAREHMHALGQAPVLPGLGQAVPMMQPPPAIPPVSCSGCRAGLIRPFRRRRRACRPASDMTEALADKVATYPATVPDQQIADALNVPAEATYGVKPVDAATSDARAILMTSGAWGKIGLIADGAYSPVSDPEQAMALRALCLTVRDAHNNLTLFKMTDPGTAAAVTGMVESLLAVDADRQGHARRAAGARQRSGVLG
jgi:hypothetical protein